jgi:putative endonuclease
MLTKQYYIYIMTNKLNTTLYIGITNDLKRRVFEHKNHLIKGFTNSYSIEKLVYYETCEDVNSAISREKQMKKGLRQKKVNLVQSFNNDWHDLYETL